MNIDFTRLTTNKSKFYSLPNGYDNDDFNIINVNEKTQSNNKIELIFAGTFYNNTENLQHNLVNALKILKVKHPLVYQTFDIKFFGSNSQFVKELSKQFDIISTFPPIPIKEIHTKIKNSDGGLLFLSDDITYSFSTKFCEYIALDKPIIVFSEWGATAQYIKENKIGYWIDINNIENHLISLFNKWEVNKTLYFNPDFDKTLFDIKYLTDDLLKIIKI